VIPGLSAEGEREKFPFAPQEHACSPFGRPPAAAQATQ
jgi:hypothetical protein